MSPFELTAMVDDNDDFADSIRSTVELPDYSDEDESEDSSQDDTAPGTVAKRGIDKCSPRDSRPPDSQPKKLKIEDSQPKIEELKIEDSQKIEIEDC